MDSFLLLSSYEDGEFDDEGDDGDGSDDEDEGGCLSGETALPLDGCEDLRDKHVFLMECGAGGGS